MIKAFKFLLAILSSAVRLVSRPAIADSLWLARAIRLVVPYAGGDLEIGAFVTNTTKEEA